MEALENNRRGVQLGERDRPGAGRRGVTKHCIVTTGISGGSSGTLLDAIIASMVLACDLGAIGVSWSGAKGLE